jgi:hypothetical protein
LDWVEHLEWCLERKIDLAEILILPDRVKPSFVGERAIRETNFHRWWMRQGDSPFAYLTFSDVARVVLPDLCRLLSELREKHIEV